MSLNIKALFSNALKYHQNGEFKKAELAYKNILIKQPNDVDTLHHLGVMFIQTNNLNHGIKLMSKVIDIMPKFAEAYNNRGIAYRNQNKHHLAINDFKAAININLKFAEAYNNLGMVYFNLKRIKDALSNCKKAIQINPNYAEAHNTIGIILTNSDKIVESISSFSLAIKLNPNYFEAYNNRGSSYSNINKTYEAIEDFKTAIKINSQFVHAYNNLSKQLISLNKLNSALETCQIAININKNFEDIFITHGNILKKMLDPQKAIESYNKCLSINSKNIVSYNARGNAYMDLNNIENAISDYKSALIINPEFSDAHSNLGLAYYKLKKNKESLNHLRKSISNNPNSPETFLNLGNTFLQMNLKNEALRNYNQSIKLNSNYAEAHKNKGDILQLYKRYDQAINSYKKASTIKPNFESLTGTLLNTKMKICDWEDYIQDYQKYKNEITKNEFANDPFISLSIIENASYQKKISEKFINTNYPINYELGQLKKRRGNYKITLAYFSVDFGDHPVTHLISDLIEIHNRDDFEIIGIYYGPKRTDQIYKRISSSFDKFICIDNKIDKNIAEYSRKLKIDIAIDLTGHTRDGKVGIFSYRVAPIQINYMGYLGTMGAEYYDYIIADKIIIPENDQKNYSEKIAYIPHYQVTYNKKEIPNKTFSREELNLPSKGFIYCSFNNNYKINPSIFNSWMSILKAVPDSVLLIYNNNEWSKENLIKEAKKNNVDHNRLVFTGRLESNLYLSRFKSADLFLDTSPYNAASTAVDALWAGLPVLTFIGETFSSRIAASILNSIGLNELITTSQLDYEKKAIELGNKETVFLNIKSKLKKNIKEKQLFNTKLYAYEIERLFKSLYNKNYF